MIHAVRAPKTAELIAHQLRLRIARRELCEGDGLPSEAQLMDQFGVSRPILREAFRILESESLIEVRRGVRGGARVRLPDPKTVARYTALLLQLQGTTLGDVLDARRAMEPAAARMVAERHSPDVLAILRACHEDELRSTNDVRARAAASARFHTTLIELSGNTSLALLIGMLSTIVDHHYTLAAVRLSREWQGFSGPYLHLIVDGHGRLLDLIEAGQAEAAEQSWRQHMQESREWVDELVGDDRSTTLVDLLNPSGAP
jgi:GntR family transcriptional regulator, transcriptional repressor for pyruvate dehydrogenase complex